MKNYKNMYKIVITTITAWMLLSSVLYLDAAWALRPPASRLGELEIEDLKNRGLSGGTSKEDKVIKNKDPNSITLHNPDKAIKLTEDKAQELSRKLVAEFGFSVGRNAHLVKYYSQNRLTVEGGSIVEEPADSTIIERIYNTEFPIQWHQHMIKRTVFIRIGYLFFIDANEYEKLKRKKSDILSEIGSNLILVKDLGDSDIAKEPYGLFTLTTIASMMRLDFSNVRFIESGAGQGFLSLAAFKLGVERNTNSLVLIEHNFLAEFPRLEAIGLKEGSDFININKDLRNQKEEIVAEMLKKIPDDGKDIIIASNIGTWKDMEDEWATNVDSIGLVPLILNSACGQVVGFVCGGIPFDSDTYSAHTDVGRLQFLNLGAQPTGMQYVGHVTGRYEGMLASSAVITGESPAFLGNPDYPAENENLIDAILNEEESKHHFSYHPGWRDMIRSYVSGNTADCIDYEVEMKKEADSFKIKRHINELTTYSVVYRIRAKYGLERPQKLFRHSSVKYIPYELINNYLASKGQDEGADFETVARLIANRYTGILEHGRMILHEAEILHEREIKAFERALSRENIMVEPDPATFNEISSSA